MDFLQDSLLESMSFGDMALRLALATVFGLALGLERERLDKPAGMRTHILVALAAATFTIMGLEVAHVIDTENTSADPVRIIEVVTAGAAFLGTATIIQARGRIEGITTGASIWLVAAIGVACGTASFALAAVATAIGLVVLYPLRRVEERLGLDEKGKDGDHGKRDG